MAPLSGGASLGHELENTFRISSERFERAGAAGHYHHDVSDRVFVLLYSVLGAMPAGCGVLVGGGMCIVSRYGPPRPA